MPKFMVSLPYAGVVSACVWASDEEEALTIALDYSPALRVSVDPDCDDEPGVGSPLEDLAAEAPDIMEAVVSDAGTCFAPLKKVVVTEIM